MAKSIGVTSNTEINDKKPSYLPELFVNREQELEIVERAIHAARAGLHVAAPVINYWGVMGIGKTWILEHLRDRYQIKPDDYTIINEPYVLPVLNRQNPPKGDTVTTIPEITRTFSIQIQQQLKRAASPDQAAQIKDTENSGDLKNLAAFLLRISGRRFIPLILIDDSQDISTADWEKIEEDLIEPLVTSTRAIIVVAGRRQVPRWRKFEVRRRLLQPEQSRVRPFNREGVQKQFESLGKPQAAELLYPFTAGTPYLVNSVAKELPAQQIPQRWLDEHRSTLFNILQQYENRLRLEVPVELNKMLEAVSFLRFYRVDALRSMLSSLDAKQGLYPDTYYLKALRELDQQTEVVWWDREQRAYITSETVRQVITRRIQLQQPGLYERRHLAAIDLYWKWANEYPWTSEDFLIEIIFHEASIYTMNQNSKSFWKTIEEILNFIQLNLNTDHKLVMQKQLEGDQEIEDLLREEFFELKNKIGELL